MYENFEIFGNAYECPLQERNPDCPFIEIEHLAFKEKVDWLEDLSKRKKELIIEHHLSCIRDREQKKTNSLKVKNIK